MYSRLCALATLWRIITLFTPLLLHEQSQAPPYGKHETSHGTISAETVADTWPSLRLLRQIIFESWCYEVRLG